MSEQKISNAGTPANTPATPATDAPVESLSAKSLWEEHGRPLVVGVLLVAAVFWGVSAWRSSKAQQKADEAAALLDALRTGDAETLRDLSSTVDTPETAAAALSAAASRFHSEARYEEALESYLALRDRFPTGDFGQTAALGIASCQEALGNPAEAAATLDAWLDANPGHFAAAFAIVDAIRVHRLSGDLAGARVRGEDWKLAHPDDAVTAARIDDALALVAQAERAAAQPAPAAVEPPAEEPVTEAPAAEEAAAPAESAESAE